MSPADLAAEFADAAEIIGAHDRQQGQGEVQLASPACERGCLPCFRECALRGIHARLWRDRLAKLCGPSAREGAIYGTIAGNC